MHNRVSFSRAPPTRLHLFVLVILVLVVRRFVFCPPGTERGGRVQEHFQVLNEPRAPPATR